LLFPLQYFVVATAGHIDHGKTALVKALTGIERFVKTMAAGVSTVDLGLLVVAANDGVMPQTLDPTAAFFVCPGRNLKF
jgi:selenocysteine-specific elongation factor